MAELNIQKFLRNRTNGIEELKTLYAIDAKRHSEYPNLVLLKYDQIDSDFKEPIVQEARGIILDEANDWNVVCYTFRKFHNQSETLAAKIDWNNAEVQEKLDGSLCQCYYYDNKWHVATSGTPDASGQVNDFGKTFKELFWETAKAQNLKTEYLCQAVCYAFELTTPYNRVVVDHKDCKIWLIGSRNVKTLEEYSLIEEFSKFYNFYFPKRFPIGSIEECIKAAEGLNPVEQEGFVVVDKNYNRVKVKSPAYVMLHHAKDSLTKKRMCKIVRKGEYEEFRQAIETLPELKNIFDEIQLAHQTMRATCEIYYEKIKHIESQKDFALRVKELDNGHESPVLFQMRKTGQTAAQVLASPKMSLDSYMGLIGIK
jgi:hypothetical protein